MYLKFFKKNINGRIPKIVIGCDVSKCHCTSAPYPFAQNGSQGGPAMNLKPAQTRILTAMHLMQEAAEMLHAPNIHNNGPKTIAGNVLLTATKTFVREAQANLDRAYFTLSDLIDELPNLELQKEENRAAA